MTRLQALIDGALDELALAAQEMQNQWAAEDAWRALPYLRRRRTVWPFHPSCLCPKCLSMRAQRCR